MVHAAGKKYMLCSSMTGREIVCAAVSQNTSIHRFEITIKMAELPADRKGYILASIACVFVR